MIIEFDLLSYVAIRLIIVPCVIQFEIDIYCRFDQNFMTNPNLLDNPLFVYKIIILGDPCIGKTCLTIRYCEDHYPTNKQATIGIDFKDKRISIDEIKVRLNIFDTAGQ